MSHSLSWHRSPTLRFPRGHADRERSSCFRGGGWQANLRVVLKPTGLSNVVHQLGSGRVHQGSFQPRPGLPGSLGQGLHSQFLRNEARKAAASQDEIPLRFWAETAIETNSYRSRLGGLFCFLWVFPPVILGLHSLINGIACLAGC